VTAGLGVRSVLGEEWSSLCIGQGARLYVAEGPARLGT
jgi:hypothetical protein